MDHLHFYEDLKLDTTSDLYRNMFPQWTQVSKDPHSNIAMLFKAVEMSLFSCKSELKRYESNVFPSKGNTYQPGHLYRYQIPLDFALPYRQNAREIIYTNVDRILNADFTMKEVRNKDENNLLLPVVGQYVYESSTTRINTSFTFDEDNETHIYYVPSYTDLYIGINSDESPFNEDKLVQQEWNLVVTNNRSNSYTYRKAFKIKSLQQTLRIQETLPPGLYDFTCSGFVTSVDVALSNFPLFNVRQETVLVSADKRQLYDIFYSLSTNEGNTTSYLNILRTIRYENIIDTGGIFLPYVNSLLLNEEEEPLENVVSWDYNHQEELIKVLVERSDREYYIYSYPRLVQDATLSYLDNENHFVNLYIDNIDYMLGDEISIETRTLDKLRISSIAYMRMKVIVKQGSETTSYYIDQSGNTVEDWEANLAPANPFQETSWDFTIDTTGTYNFILEAIPKQDKNMIVNIGQKMIVMSASIPVSVASVYNPESYYMFSIKCGDEGKILVDPGEGGVHIWSPIYRDAYVDYPNNTVYCVSPVEEITVEV